MGLNKIIRFIFLIFLLSSLTTKILLAGTISFSNFDSKIEVQSEGTPINGGFVSVGTTEASVFTDRQSLYQSFVQFGNSATISGASAFNLDGYFSGAASGDGGLNQFSGKNIFLLGGDGNSLTTSESIFLINTGKTFKPDAPLFAETVDLSDGTIIVGELSGQPVANDSLGAIQVKAFETLNLYGKDPVLYFDFEGDLGTTVKDKSPYKNDGIIKKVNETILGVEGGAPAGPTPLTALQFNKGLIDVPGVKFADVASGSGSYTMSAWIKPVGLFAPSFIFGQSNQGIYNGIRDFGFLHQNHWKPGSNSKGKTDLNTYLENDADGWIQRHGYTMVKPIWDTCTWTGKLIGLEKRIHLQAQEI